MATPLASVNFGDLLDIRISKIFHDQYTQLADMIPTLYNMEPTNGRNNMQWSQVGTLPDWTEFNGSINYQSVSQGYKTTGTPVEFGSGIQVERKLYDDDQFNIINQRPKQLATSAQRTRQKHAARPLNMAFAIDNYFYVNGEGVSLCSDSHTTNSGASVATGFDNKVTSALTATAVAAARIQARGYRGDQAERIDVMMDEIWIPPDLYEVGFEIINAQGKLDTANNNPNVHKGKYELYEWNYLTSTKNWFMCDSSKRKDSLFWSDRIKIEFAMAEDLDTLVAKWRGYGRWFNAVVDWRWILGASVT